MSYASFLVDEITSPHSLTLLLVVLVVTLCARLLAVVERRRLRALFILTALYLILVPVIAGMRANQTGGLDAVTLAQMLFSVLVFAGAGGILLFGLVLPRLGVRAPRILRDVLTALAGIVGIIFALNRIGFSVTGLITTSAVLTAVIGLSLQDTIGNVMGGLALQMDNSVQVGDWVRVGEISGQVVEIRWRYTSIETRDWETVIVPNNVLMKGQVTVVGRRTGQPLQWRRAVFFHVDLRTPPSEVIARVNEALGAWPIERVAATPPPSCRMNDFGPSAARYAVRYWLTDPGADEPTDSEVRVRIVFALQRMGVTPAIPAQAVFVTEENEQRKEHKARTEADRRLRALGRVDLFDHLSDEDRRELAARLRFTPFTRGEAMCRQGDPGDCLYFISDGEAAVRVGVDGVEREVARLGPGRFFGEMSLMTGEKRSATVVALGDVKTYLLDKAAFQEMLEDRPALAEEMAEVLARRRTELAAARENLDAAARARHMAAAKSDFLGKIRNFFGLPEERARA